MFDLIKLIQEFEITYSDSNHISIPDEGEGSGLI